MIRGLTHDWSFPIFVQFDQGLTKENLFKIINEIEKNGIEILATISDQGGRNESLAKSLQITARKPFFQNPFDESRDIFFIFDWNHVFKNWRNNILDKITVFANGIKASKKDIQELFDFVKSKGLSLGDYLKEIMLNCQSSDRQTVSHAMHLMSEKTANLFRLYFSHDKSKLMFADLFETLGQGINTHLACN